MANLQLSLAITNNPRTRPIIDGRVKIEGVDFIKTVLGPAEMFWRQLRFAEFDVSEISMSELMMIRSRGDERFIGIPVFTTRRFYHTAMLVRKNAGIGGPADLKGKRIGVPEYVQTAALWTRGVLESEFGVRPSDMNFFMERVPERSHAGAIGFKAPPGVTINQIPPEKSIASMLLAGELDAYMAYFRKDSVDMIDRSYVDLENHPDIKTAVRRSRSRSRALLQENRRLSDQSWHGDQARSCSTASRGSQSTSSKLSSRRMPSSKPSGESTSSTISKPAWCLRNTARRWRRHSLRTA